MNVEQIIETLRTNPESWEVIFQSDDSIVFAWGDYRFTRLSDRFDCVTILNSKYDRVNIDWAANDPDISQLYQGLVSKHLGVNALKR